MEPLALVAALGLFVTLVVRLRRAAAPRSQAIASLRPGWAEVRGRALASEAEAPLVVAPISGRAGLAWRLVVEQEAGVRGWETIIDRGECLDFRVEDDSGSILVRASHSPLVLDVAEQRGRGGPFAPPPFAVERLIVRSASPRGVLFHKSFRWREWVLGDGREVRVRARAVSETSEETLGYRKLGNTLVLAGGASRPIEVAE